MLSFVNGRAGPHGYSNLLRSGPSWQVGHDRAEPSPRSGRPVRFGGGPESGSGPAQTESRVRDLLRGLKFNHSTLRDEQLGDHGGIRAFSRRAVGGDPLKLPHFVLITLMLKWGVRFTRSIHATFSKGNKADITNSSFCVSAHSC